MQQRKKIKNPANKKINKSKEIKKKKKIKIPLKSSQFVTTGLDRSVMELFEKKKQPSYTKVPSLFHIPNRTNAYPSLEDDRMVQQLYYRQENERVAKNLSITVVVDGGWAWDEKEFAGLVTRFRICYCLLHLLLVRWL